MTTLGELRALAQTRQDEGNLLGGLKILRLVLEAAPLDFTVRLHIADLLRELGRPPLAAAVYVAVAVHCMKAGLPLLALVAIKALGRENQQAPGLTNDFAALYGKESPLLGQSVRPAPTDWSAQVRDDLDLDFAMADDKLCTTTAEMAAYLDNITKYPERLPPVPLFSGIATDAVARVVGSLELRRFQSGEVILQQGEAGREFFVLAQGMVTICRDSDNGEHHLADLGEGFVLGEMALLAAEPRVASVRTKGRADLLVFTRDALAALAGDLPQVGALLESFATERLVRNLVNTAPIFAPFALEEKQNLLQRFEAHRVTPGTVIVRQGEEARGIYLILYGAVEVIRAEPTGERHSLAILESGESFGEISCVQDQPTTALVQALRDSTIMFLPKEHFDTLVEAVPQVAEYYVDLTVQRLIENRRADPAGDVIVHDGVIRL